jgi:hypothetical protein
MEKLVCTSCGAPIDPKTGICPYCGSRYRIDYDLPRPVPIMIEHPRIQGLGARVCCSMEEFEHIPPDELSKIVIDRLAHKMANALVGYMDIETHKDYNTRSYITDARLRVVPPDFRF